MSDDQPVQPLPGPLHATPHASLADAMAMLHASVAGIERTARSLDAMVRALAAQRGMQRAMPPTVPMQMDPRRPR